MLMTALAIAATVAALKAKRATPTVNQPNGRMSISQAGINALIQREGKRNKAYKDSVGIWTVGVGHALGREAKFKDVFWDDVKIALELDKDLDRFENVINNDMQKHGYRLTQNQFDALVSFAFNIGDGGFLKSNTRSLLIKRDYANAGDAMMGWSKPAEIIGRRKSEVKQYYS